MNSLAKVRATMITACVALVLTACSKSPESTVESFYEAVADGEITEARSYLSDQILGMMGEKKITAGLTEQYEKMQACEGIKNIEVEMKGEGELRSGTVTITFKGDCQPKVEKTKLIEEDGVWKITASK